MGLITTESFVQVSVQQKQEVNKFAMVNSLNMNFQMLVDAVSKSFDRLWSNPDLTPQEVLDSFGTDAAQLFMISRAAITMINTIKPGYWTKTPPFNYTINTDGTVTVGSRK